jgi:hypothetical protein
VFAKDRDAVDSALQEHKTYSDSMAYQPGHLLVAVVGDSVSGYDLFFERQPDMSGVVSSIQDVRRKM